MAQEEKASTQPKWDFPARDDRLREVIQLPNRQPTYPPPSHPKPGRNPR